MTDLQTYLSRIPGGDLDKPIDHRNTNLRGQIIHKDLGLIADEMESWEGKVAEALGLSRPDIANIRGKFSDKLDLQK